MVDKGSLRVFFDNGRSNSELHYTTYLYNSQRLRCQIISCLLLRRFEFVASSGRPGAWTIDTPVTEGHGRIVCGFAEGAQLLSASTQKPPFPQDSGWITGNSEVIHLMAGKRAIHRSGN